MRNSLRQKWYLATNTVARRSNSAAPKIIPGGPGGDEAESLHLPEFRGGTLLRSGANQGTGKAGKECKSRGAPSRRLKSGLPCRFSRYTQGKAALQRMFLKGKETVGASKKR